MNSTTAKCRSVRAGLALLILASTGHADPLDTWILRSPPGTLYSLRAVTFANEQFVAVGESRAVLTSSNAVNWVTQSGGNNALWLVGIAYGAGRFVASATGPFGGDVNILNFVTSSNGATWGPETTELGGVFVVTYDGGQFVAVSEPGPVLTSTDGVNWDWRTVNRPTTSGLRAIIYADQRFVAVGDLGTILTSADATNWVQRQSGTRIGLTGIAANGGLLVTVGGDYPYSAQTNYQVTESIVLTSSNGVDWVQRPSVTTNLLSAVGYGNGQFVAVGAAGTILSSADGINWTERKSGTQTDLLGVSYGNGHFVAVGDDGTILESGSIISIESPEPPAQYVNRSRSANL